MDKRSSNTIIALAGILIIFSALVPVYWGVSHSYPDGLDKLLEQQNVHEKESAYSPPFATFRGYGDTTSLYLLSGVGGAVIVFVILLLIGKIAKRGRREDGP